MLLEIMEQGKWELAALSLTLGLTLVLSGHPKNAFNGLQELLDGDDGQAG